MPKEVPQPEGTPWDDAVAAHEKEAQAGRRKMAKKAVAGHCADFAADAYMAFRSRLEDADDDLLDLMEADIADLRAGRALKVRVIESSDDDDDDDDSNDDDVAGAGGSAEEKRRKQAEALSSDEDEEEEAPPVPKKKKKKGASTALDSSDDDDDDDEDAGAGADLRHRQRDDLQLRGRPAARPERRGDGRVWLFPGRVESQVRTPRVRDRRSNRGEGAPLSGRHFLGPDGVLAARQAGRRGAGPLPRARYRRLAAGLLRAAPLDGSDAGLFAMSYFIDTTEEGFNAKFRDARQRER